MGSKRKYWLACGVAISTLPALPAAAQPRSIDIPSEEAAKSIPEFARQENIQIIAPVSQLHGINTPAVSGSMTLDEALKALLVGSGGNGGQGGNRNATGKPDLALRSHNPPETFYWPSC